MSVEDINLLTTAFSRESKIILQLCLAGLFIGLSVKFADKKMLKSRHDRFLATMISKKIFAWWLANYFFMIDKLNADLWVMFTLGIFGIDVGQKYIGMNRDTSESYYPQPVIPRSAQDGIRTDIEGD